jgi:hypothetical protein
MAQHYLLHSGICRLFEVSPVLLFLASCLTDYKYYQGNESYHQDNTPPHTGFKYGLYSRTTAVKQGHQQEYARIKLFHVGVFFVVICLTMKIVMP